MPLLDRTYFDGPILLIVAGNEDAIDASIAQYETEYLMETFGPSFYGAFVAGLAAVSGHHFSTQFSTQFNHGTIADRWKWIRDGYIYTANGRTYVWPGIRKPLANYVYWNYRRDNATRTTSTGAEVASRQENAVVVSADLKMVRAWNAMVDWNLVLYRFIYNNGLYPEFNSREIGRDVYEKQNIFNI